MGYKPHAKRYNYPDDFAGDTVRAKLFTVCRNDQPEVDFTVLIEFKDRDGVVVQSFTPPVVDNTFTIPKFSIATSGVYSYNIVFKYPDGDIETYVFGSIKLTDR